MRRLFLHCTAHAPSHPPLCCQPPPRTSRACCARQQLGIARRAGALLTLISSTIEHNANNMLTFHLILPQALHPKCASLLARFRTIVNSSDVMFGFGTLGPSGADAKITRLVHSTQYARNETPSVAKRKAFEEDDPLLFRWALAYLPNLLPRLRRVIFLDVDVLVQADLLPLWYEPLRGFPIGAVTDCSTRLERIPGLGSIHPDFFIRGCTFEPGVLLVDLDQWGRLDLTSRIEHWTQQYAHVRRVQQKRRKKGSKPRAAKPLEPTVPFALAFHKFHTPLHPLWNQFGLGER